MPKLKRKRSAKNIIDNKGRLEIYGIVGDWWDSNDAKSIKDCISSFSKKMKMVIHSEGGDITEGLAIFNNLSKFKGDLTIEIDGLAASMASVICMPINATLSMPENSFMMIHEAWAGIEGTADELNSAADMLNKLQDNIVDIYHNKSMHTVNKRGSGKALSKKQILAMLKKETWLSGQECFDFGLCDKVTPEQKTKNSLKAAKNRVIKIPNRVYNIINNKGLIEMKKKSKSKIVKSDKSLHKGAKSLAKDAESHERKRCKAINEICTKFKLPSSQANLFIEQGLCLDTVRKKALNYIAKKNKDQYVTTGKSSSFNNEQKTAKMIKGMSNSLCHKMGVHKKMKKGGAEFSNMTMLDMSREILESGGKSCRNETKMSIAKMVMSTSDFPILLEDVANKKLMEAYGSYTKTFMPFCSRTTLADFKNTHNVEVLEDIVFEKANENGEFKYTSIDESKEKYKLSRFGRMMKFSYELLVNDSGSLNALQNFTNGFASASARLENETVWRIITSNQKLQSDNKAIFHASHNNLASVAAALDKTSLSEARTAMRNQTQIAGSKKRLNLIARYILIPPELETTFNEINAVITPAKGSDVQQFANAFKPIIEPLLGDNSVTAWYLATNPNEARTIEYAYLEGNESVSIASEFDFKSDGMLIKASQSFGAGPLGFTGLYKNAGA